MNKPTPRINSRLREKYVGQTVRMSGQVISYKGDTAVIKAVDGGQVLIKLSSDNQWSAEFVEVIGQVEKDFSLIEFTTVGLGNNFDLDLASKAVEYSQNYPEVFG